MEKNRSTENNFLMMEMNMETIDSPPDSTAIAPQVTMFGFYYKITTLFVSF